MASPEAWARAGCQGDRSDVPGGEEGQSEIILQSIQKCGYTSLYARAHTHTLGCSNYQAEQKIRKHIAEEFPH